jgi:hypothetical protein
MKAKNVEAQTQFQSLMTAGIACVSRALESIVEGEELGVFEHETEAQAYLLLKGNLRSALLLMSVISISDNEHHNARFRETAIRGITRGMLQ